MKLSFDVMDLLIGVKLIFLKFSMTKISIFLLILITLHLPLMASGESWKLNGAISSMTGSYQASMVMNNQRSVGMSFGGEFEQHWGFSGGVQTTRIDLTALSPTPTQKQDNWSISGHWHEPSEFEPGRWTFQLNGHKIYSTDVSGISDGARVIVPKVTWLSYTNPLKLDMSYAVSSYRNIPAIHQYSAGVGMGINGQKNWLEIHHHYINGLIPTQVFDRTYTHATDIQITQKISSSSKFVPSTITLGFETGQRIYNIDTATQTVYNLPMLNKGGRNISANWELSPTEKVVLYSARSKYSAAEPFLHNFNLNTLGFQYLTSW